MVTHPVHSCMSSRLPACHKTDVGIMLINSWWRQLAPYLISMIFMKLLVVLPLTLPYISTALLRFGHDMLDFLQPSIQIVFVMAVFPVIMNIVQFCIFDQIIKAGKEGESEGDKGEHTEDGGEGGYRRVPTRDIESSPRSDRMRRRPSGSGSKRGRSASREGRIRSGLSTPVPNSPLLEPSSVGSRMDYGSTTPSPSLNAIRGGLGPDGTFWQNITSGASAGTGSRAKSQGPGQLSLSIPSTSPQDSSLAISTATATTRHDWRSGAPSPESFRPDYSQDGQIPSIDLSNVSSATATARTDSSSASGAFGHVSRLSEDMGREARKQLSPRTEGTLSFANGGMGLEDLPKQD
jgi:hypothetical protein